MLNHLRNVANVGTTPDQVTRPGDQTRWRISMVDEPSVRWVLHCAPRLVRCFSEGPVDHVSGRWPSTRVHDTSTVVYFSWWSFSGDNWRNRNSHHDMWWYLYSSDVVDCCSIKPAAVVEATTAPVTPVTHWRPPHPPSSPSSSSLFQSWTIVF